MGFGEVLAADFRLRLRVIFPPIENGIRLLRPPLLWLRVECVFTTAGQSLFNSGQQWRPPRSQYDGDRVSSRNCSGGDAELGEKYSYHAEAAAGDKGTGKRAMIDGYSVGGKTGTCTRSRLAVVMTIIVICQFLPVSHR